MTKSTSATSYSDVGGAPKDLTSDLKMLRKHLDELGASSVQRLRFEENVPKSLAALSKAFDRKANSPLLYALSILGAEPTAIKTRDLTSNRSVAVVCETCDGDRFVPWEKQPDPYDVSYAPCPDCNSNCNTVRTGFACPSPTRVRERLAAV